MNKVIITKATWNGNNSNAWEKDILAVNGFDKRMCYGTEDHEFGERLMHNGILLASKSVIVQLISI